MSDQAGPNGGRTERIATSTNWAAAHRLMTVFGVPLALAALGWLVVRVEGMDAALVERDKMIAVSDQKIVTVEQKNGEQDRRITDLETWRYNQPVRR